MNDIYEIFLGHEDRRDWGQGEITNLDRELQAEHIKNSIHKKLTQKEFENSISEYFRYH